jgi:hypothetical protein
MMEVWIVIALWVITGVISIGLFFAYCYHDYIIFDARQLTDSDKLFCVSLSLFGPFSLVAAILLFFPNRKNHKVKWLWPWGKTLRKLQMIHALKQK